MTALAGLRVLEAGSGVGAAFCSKLLGQLGAHVIKVVNAESAGPPPTEEAALRARAERVYLDEGKEQVACSLDSGAFLGELRRCDVLIRGLDPATGSAAAGLREEYDAFRREQPGLIYVALTPFGTTGSAAAWAGGDLHAQGLSGWVSINGNPDEPPLSVGYGVGAIKQGLSAVGAALAALLARGDESRGEFIDISEAQVVAAMIRNYVLVYRWNRIELVRSGTRAPGSSGRYPHATFPCKNGAVTLMVRSDVEWKRFLSMIGSPAWADLERYKDMFAMATEYADEVDELIAPWIRERTKEELSALATEHGVALATVRTADEVVDDVQFAHRGFFHEAVADGVTVRIPGLPALWHRPEEA